MPPHPLPAEGFVRLKSILAPSGPIPVCKSTWWAGVASGRYPKSFKLGPRITAWRVDDIRNLCSTLGLAPEKDSGRAEESPSSVKKPGLKPEADLG